jgi:opacity protein-like surface antigen
MVGFACLAVAAGRVYAEGEGPFLNTDFGASFITGQPQGISVDPGIRFSLMPGYRVYNDDVFSVSLQLDTGLIWNSYKGSARGDLYQVPFLAGFEYAFHAGSVLEPYFGVAGGGNYMQDSGSENDISKTAGAVQAMAGLRFKLSKHAELGVGYKFLASFPSGVDYLGDHSVSATLVLRF